MPYRTNGILDRLEFGTAGKIVAWFSMANQGAPARSAAHFSIQPTAYRSTEPWQYTVDAGGSASDYLNIGTGYGDGKYDITMTGPNRFLRRFTRDATKPGKSLEVAARYAAAPDTGRTAIWFRLSNASTAAVKFTLGSNNYRADGPWTYTVPAGGSTEDYFNAVAGQNGWYDFTVTADADSTWSRRYTGHIETGAASISG
ncbi:phospholipase domain-containing protein [Streptomyces sp. NPDC057909]|uniref:phospholipase domain-containing protein n=1 Tax=Streptomyces sp. NPDC057909 TaxID=3346277 RepID=UPI0036EFB7B2